MAADEVFEDSREVSHLPGETAKAHSRGKVPERPVDFAHIFREECEAIKDRRSIQNGGTRPSDVAGNLFGICFSGGGIRSATFNLGILQGLAERRLLRLADYLSTVSGGGYIGSWFQGLCHRQAWAKLETKYADTEDYLKRETQTPEPAETDPITFLRKYSNYLAPQLGVFSADMWVIFTVWLRNMVLNQVIFSLSLAGAFLLPIVFGNLAILVSGSLNRTSDVFTSWLVFSLLMILVPLGWAVAEMSKNLKRVVEREFDSRAGAADGDASVWLRVALPILVATTMLSVLIANGGFHLLGDTVASSGSTWMDAFEKWKTGILAAAALMFLFWRSLTTGGFVQCYDRQHPGEPGKRRLLAIVIILICSAVTFGLLFAVNAILPHRYGEVFGHEMWHCLTWGPPLLVLALASGVGLQIGLMGIDFPDSAREWYSRLAAKLLILCVGWTAAFVLAVFAPMFVIWLFKYWTKTGLGATAAWLATTVAGFQAGKSGSSAGTPPASAGAVPRANPALDMVAKVAPPLAVAGFLIAISTTSFLMIEKMWPLHPPATAAQEAAAAQPASLLIEARGAGSVKVDISQTKSGSFIGPFLAESHVYRALSLDSSLNCWVFGSAAMLLLAALGMSARVNINEFSMNHFYKNRLVRCYLGASHGSDRHPNRFTGFDPRDDILLTKLKPGKEHDAPYPILNCALNLNHGAELAWQERKASSFIFTPLYCGYKPARASSHGAGYVPTKHFTRHGGPHIGLAVAVSGAAANPNWGYHTSPVTAFLMTIFNVRLGWWVGNTLKPKYAEKAGPRVALRCLFSELLGLTSEDSTFVNLSDGGHFENLGLYELIRRECAFIIVGDGEQDENYVFESLGGAIRKVRIDFGAEIRISPKRIFLTQGWSTVHCATGTIEYQSGRKGQLLYIKSSLTGDEPWDIGQYKKGHDAFPHETTMNQFFTESQFESYRALGRHAVERIFEKAPPAASHADLNPLFDSLIDNWLPPTSADAGAFTKHSLAYSGLLKRLSQDEGLRFLDSQLLPNFAPATVPPPDSPEMRKAMLLATDFIQLMEDVYVDLNLEDIDQKNHPQNQGWIALFKHWKEPGTVLNDVWQKAGATYGKAFQRFLNNL